MDHTKACKQENWSEQARNNELVDELLETWKYNVVMLWTFENSTAAFIEKMC